MKKSEVLKHIIDSLMCFAIPSMNPDDFVELERITGDLHKHYTRCELNFENK